MNRIISSVIISAALIFGVFLPREEALAQAAKDLVGTWTLVSVSFERPDSSKGDMFGPNPLGILLIDGAGRVAYQEMRSDLPKFASNNRLEGTAEGNKAVVQGCICAFGTYSVDAAAKTRWLESGSHAELLLHNGTYARLWRRQSGGFTSELLDVAAK